MWSTKRRQDAPDLPKKTMAKTTLGRTFTGNGGTVYRPSMFVTVTLPSYGRVDRTTGVPEHPDRYDYQSAARDAIHFSRLLDRLVQNLRRVAGSTCSTSPPSSHSGGWLRTRTLQSGARLRGR